MLTTRPAKTEDHAAVAALLTAAFATPAEAALVARLRAAGAVASEVVAQAGGQVVGQALCSWMVGPRGWVALAPVAVLPGRQGQGIGSRLVHAALDLAEATGARAAVVLGAPAFYGRFGFSIAEAAAMTSPYPIAFTAVRSFGPALSAAERGTMLHYPPAFAALDD